MLAVLALACVIPVSLALTKLFLEGWTQIKFNVAENLLIKLMLSSCKRNLCLFVHEETY